MFFEFMLLMKNWFYIALGFIALLVLLLYFMAEDPNKEIKRLEAKIQFLKETTSPLQFKIDSLGQNKIFVSVKFLDSDKNQIELKQFALRGEELSFDFIIIKEDERFVAFPYKIFTDEIAPDFGVSLFEMYAKDHFPLIFHYKGIDWQSKKRYNELFDIVKNDSLIDVNEKFGNAVHDIKHIKSFEVGQVYEIICHAKGGLEIKKGF